jgi:uncharacterized protein (TIGR00288 family)
LVDANVAVLIDYENVGLDAIQHLLDQLSDVGRVIIRRAYGDWSVQRGKQDQLLELGIEPIHQYHSNKSGKNSSDIRLAIEAVDLLYNSPIDTFVIVSSDSDFVPLVGKLRSSGKSVIVAGRREATSPTLIKSCDRYIFLDAEKRTTASQSRRRTNRRNGSQASQTASAEADAKALLLRAMDVSMDEIGDVVGSKLYQTMRRIEPSFNFKDLKFRLFTQFLEAHTDVIEITRPKDGSGDVVVQLVGRDQITPPPVRADNEKRAARLIDPRNVTQAPNEQPSQDDKPRAKSDRAQSNRRQTGTRSQPRRRLLGSTRPQADEPEVKKPNDDLNRDKVEEATSLEVVAKTKEPQKSEKDDAKASKQKSEKDTGTFGDTNGVAPNVSWEVAVDAAWAKRDADKIAGRSAASDAAKILGTTRLSDSEYPTLAKLLSASTLLQLNWRREGNAIFRK